MYAADMAKEKQESLVDGDLEQMAQANMEERHKRLYRRKLPKQRTLKETLAEMTKAELDDVRYNLGLKGASSLKKAALVESLAEEVPRFAERGRSRWCSVCWSFCWREGAGRRCCGMSFCGSSICAASG